MPKSTRARVVIGLAVAFAVAAAVVAVVWAYSATRWPADPREAVPFGLRRIEATDAMRLKFVEADEVVQRVGVDAIFQELNKRSLAGEAEQVLLIQASRSGDVRFRPLLLRLADAESRVSHYVRAALGQYPATQSNK